MNTIPRTWRPGATRRRALAAEARAEALTRALVAVAAAASAQDSVRNAAAGLPAPRPGRHLAVVRRADDLDAS